MPTVCDRRRRPCLLRRVLPQLLQCGHPTYVGASWGEEEVLRRAQRRKELRHQEDALARSEVQRILLEQLGPMYLGQKRN